MDIKEKLALRKEYELSGKSKIEFAKFKSIEKHKMHYILRKAMEHLPKTAKVSFKKIKVNTLPMESKPTLVIHTSYGSTIEIPL